MNLINHKQVEPPKQFNPVQITLEFKTENELRAFGRMFCHCQINDAAGIRNQEAVDILNMVKQYTSFNVAYRDTNEMAKILKGY